MRRSAGLPEDVWKAVTKIQGYSLTKLVKFLRITGCTFEKRKDLKNNMDQGKMSLTRLTKPSKSWM